MMGYGLAQQETIGLHIRLFARAFVFANTDGQRVVFVSAELGQLFSSVKQGVIKELTRLYGGMYSDENVMISATHTHAGPGGYSHHAMYNLTTLGHVAQNYEAIVAGITEAVVQAHENLAPATLSIATDRMFERASVNRSEVAFLRNREIATPSAGPGVGSGGPGLGAGSGGPGLGAGSGEPVSGGPGLVSAGYLVEPFSNEPVNWEMSVLGIHREGRGVGAISWFPVHNTSMSQGNRLVSSDHKGFAAYRFERMMGTVAPFQNPGGFVAAFPNGAEGDMSPNIAPGFRGPAADASGPQEFRSMEIIGDREYATAVSLFARPSQTRVTGDVDFRHRFVQMPGFVVTSTDQQNGEGGVTLCTAAYGFSFMAGSEDGPTGSSSEGLVMTSTTEDELERARSDYRAGMPTVFRDAAANLVGDLNDRCQLPKPVLLHTGRLRWTPEIVPFQLLRLGSVAIAGIPAEMTIQAGRRLQARILSALQPVGVQSVVLTGLANEYSGYVVTPEEYDTQQYEGASTLFGRLTFEAYLQIFGELAEAMAAGSATSPGPTPPDLSRIPQIELRPGVVLDDMVPGGEFGEVLTQPPASVSRGATVEVRFRSGHPKNDLRRNDTYLRIERNVGGPNWELVAWDSMPETMILWRRLPPNGLLLGLSAVDVVWRIPEDAEPGTYRISHAGRWKNGITGALIPYQGTTQTFEVR
jgi:neutral ceramidase